MSNPPAQDGPRSSVAADDDLASIERDLASARDAVSSTGAAGNSDDDLDRTQSLPSYVDDQPTQQRVTRDELYQANPDEADRVASVRADYEANPSVDTNVTPVAPAPPQSRAKPRKLKYTPTTDKFLPSVGLLVLRLVTGVIMGVHGLQKFLTIEQTANFFETLNFFGYPLPLAGTLAIVTAAAETLLAMALIFGFATRLAGFGVLLISVGALLMVKMKTIPNPFVPIPETGQIGPGFSGELELLLAAVGFALLLLGGGGLALDRLFRRGRYTNPNQLGMGEGAGA